MSVMHTYGNPHHTQIYKYTLEFCYSAQVSSVYAAVIKAQIKSENNKSVATTLK